jgi:nicotinamide-nucleotide amidase
MKAEIIAVGSELLTPEHLDTNSLFLTERLNDAGFEVHLKTVVGDDEDEIAGVLRGALQRSKLVIFSGGLGPTEDDLTRTAVAKVLYRTISLDPSLLEALRQRFASRGYNMPKINERQAEVIHGAEILQNAFGTAPGMWMEENGVHLALLPGPPRELRAMFDAAVLPRVLSLGRGRTLAKRVFHVTGMTESEVDSHVAPIYKAYPRVQTTVLASTGHIALRLNRWLELGEDPKDLDKLASKIREALGDAIFTDSGESLEQVVGRQLRESGRTLAVAESCTSGMIGMRITRVPGSSDYFLGGILCYSNEVKMSLCGVPEKVLREHGAVSAEVAEALARGVRNSLKSSVGLSATGIAGPGGGSAEKPVGLVFVGLSDGERTAHWRRIIPGDRETIRERATYFALSLLRRFLLHLRDAENVNK